eukprot:5127185-Prymnesium_polylepis.1
MRALYSNTGQHKSGSHGLKPHAQRARNMPPTGRRGGCTQISLVLQLFRGCFALFRVCRAGCFAGFAADLRLFRGCFALIRVRFACVVHSGSRVSRSIRIASHVKGPLSSNLAPSAVRCNRRTL